MYIYISFKLSFCCLKVVCARYEFFFFSTKSDWPYFHPTPSTETYGGTRLRRSVIISNASRPMFEVKVPMKAWPLARSSTSAAVSMPMRAGSPSPARSLRSMNPALNCSSFCWRWLSFFAYLPLVLLHVFGWYHDRSTGAYISESLCFSQYASASFMVASSSVARKM